MQNLNSILYSSETLLIALATLELIRVNHNIKNKNKRYVRNLNGIKVIKYSI